MLTKKKKEWIINQKLKKVLSTQSIASAQGISRRTVERIWKSYQKLGITSLSAKQIGRPEVQLPFAVKQQVINLRKEGHGIRRIEGLLKLRKIYVSHNKIHKILKRMNLVIAEPKKGKRKQYVRWERKHSNSLWQTDFCWVERLQCWLCAWLDDHSRFVPIAQYMSNATTENVLRIFDKAAQKHGYPGQTLSDRGTQFWPNRGGTSRFVEHLHRKGVEHIYASIKKPTTCGKLERFWGTHNKERWNFSSLEKFIEYYNYQRPHMSLDYLTPYEVFLRDMK
jgi:putative transposase|tara:strand:- start:26 stop:865 length:840 start_codon:yes stop_codon:yes gene_type:complete